MVALAEALEGAQEVQVVVAAVPVVMIVEVVVIALPIQRSSSHLKSIQEVNGEKFVNERGRRGRQEGRRRLLRLPIPSHHLMRMLRGFLGNVSALFSH